MKRAAFIASCLLFLAALAWSSRPTPVAEAIDFAPNMPHGAILYLQARDFSALLRDWNDSGVKQDWLKSADYKVFAESRLFLRLKEAQGQFAEAAGLPPDMKFLVQGAGKQCALALYDIGNLEFLYISKISSSDAMQSALWQSRAKFEPRSAGGTPFYVRADAASQRVAAFAITNDTLFLATREELLAGALEDMAGGKEPKLSDEAWYHDAHAAAHEAGDLRLVLNLNELVKSPHFRSYWVQRNVSELRQFSSSVSDLYRSGDTYREERVFLRNENEKTTVPAAGFTPAVTPQGQQAVAELLAAVPDEAGFYRAAANPSPQESLTWIAKKLLTPRTTSAPASTSAPSVQLTNGEVGSSADLETKTDEPAIFAAKTKDQLAALREFLEKTGALAELQVQSTRQDPDTSFVRMHSAIVLATSNDWDGEAARAALQSAVVGITTQGLGTAWRSSGKGSNEYFELDGQFPLCLAVRGKFLLLSDRAELLNSISFHSGKTPATTEAVSASGINFARETANFATLTRLLDNSSAAENSSSNDTPGEPPFFSGNLASLSQVLSGVKSESIITRESGGKVLQTLTYQWNRETQ
jgi:hypothetical protein